MPQNRSDLSVPAPPAAARPAFAAAGHGRERRLAVVAAVSVVTMVAWFLWEGRLGLSLADEGFLWYGVQRVLLGEVPIRDFMAYDPGRYYLSAALVALRGDDVLSFRLVLALIQGLALLLALGLIAKAARQRDLWLLALSAMTLAAWIIPRHKAFDIALSVGLVAVLAVVLQKPSLRRIFMIGCFVGLAAVFGRNHGVYSAITSLAVILLLVAKDGSAPPLPRALAHWSAGVALGYLPVLLMLFLVPGFADAFWASIRFHWELRATNLPLPVPWPWQADLSDGLTSAGLRSVLTGALFVSVLAFASAGPLAALSLPVRRLQAQPVLIAAAFAALPYAHVAFSRADQPHLAQAIFPLLIAVLSGIAQLPRIPRRALAAGVCGASLFVILPIHPGAACFGGTGCVRVAVDRSILHVDPQSAAEIEILRALAAEHAPAPRPFLTAPFWPGAYALLRRRAPIWEIYPLFPRSVPFQQSEIARLRAADPGFALVINLALDGREELRFAETHPLIDAFLTQHFVRRDDLAPNPAFRLYLSPDQPGAGPLPLPGPAVSSDKASVVDPR